LLLTKSKYLIIHQCSAEKSLKVRPQTFVRKRLPIILDFFCGTTIVFYLNTKLTARPFKKKIVDSFDLITFNRKMVFQKLLVYLNWISTFLSIKGVKTGCQNYSNFDFQMSFVIFGIAYSKITLVVEELKLLIFSKIHNLAAFAFTRLGKDFYLYRIHFLQMENPGSHLFVYVKHISRN